MQIMLILGIMFYVLISSDRSAYYMVQLIRALQLITHFPLINIILQGIVINQYDIVIPLVQFDYLDAFVDWEDQNVLEFNDTQIE